MTKAVKICPIRSNEKQKVKCMRNECAWFNDKYNNCAITVLSYEFQKIRESSDKFSL